MGYPEGIDWSGTASLAFDAVFCAPVGALALAVLGTLWTAPGALILAAVARLKGVRTRSMRGGGREGVRADVYAVGLSVHKTGVRQTAAVLDRQGGLRRLAVHHRSNRVSHVFACLIMADTGEVYRLKLIRDCVERRGRRDMRLRLREFHWKDAQGDTRRGKSPPSSRAKTLIRLKECTCDLSVGSSFGL